ncbi:MAG: radical SAM protein, partial [Lachnospiraceae bacterium]|nr:radical SAM protein [Lachnospiraceae bacterium]
NSLSEDMVERLAKVCDLVMLDIKHADEDGHKKLTGATGKNIKAFAHKLSDLGVKMWIRHVLVPGVNDDEESLKKLRSFIDELKTVERVEVLPYHTMGKYKWEDMGLNYPLKDTEPPTEESIKKAKEILGAK